MLTFNSIQLITLISNFFWPLIRILSFFATAPIFNDKLINKKTKILLSFLVSYLIYPFLPKIHEELFSFLGFFLLLQQILIGIVLGLSVQFLFSVVHVSGEILGLQMGLSFATFFNHNIHIGTSIISRLLNILILFLFLAFDTHLYLISILIDSFYSIPIGSYFFNKNIFFTLLMFFSNVFLNGLIFSLPIIICLLTLNCVMSVLNRLSPQISIFSIGFPLNLLVGMLILYSFIYTILPFFNNLLKQLIVFTSDIFLIV